MGASKKNFMAMLFDLAVVSLERELVGEVPGDKTIDGLDDCRVVELRF